MVDYKLGIQQKKLRKENTSELIFTLSIILLLVFISNFVFTRIDLTSDKRYTLSANTKTMLNQIDDIVYFKVYLTGDLPAGFIRLENATREILDEFAIYGNKNIQYEFIDPAENSDEKARNKYLGHLYKKGLNPIDLKVKEKDGSNSQKYILPGILVTYKGKEFPVNILKQYIGYTPEGNLNASMQALEYELTFAIHQLTTTHIPKIGFIKGHGELENLELNDMAKTLSEFYKIEGVFLDEYPYSLTDSLGTNRYDLIVLAKPSKRFSEKDKFIIDQFVMKGGRSLWLVDNVIANMDSLAYNRSTMALSNSLNLDDQLFKYGIRINPNLIQDMQCAVIPVNTAINGQEAKFAPAPWIYAPLLSPVQNNPITQNLDMVKSEFVSSIDTVGESSMLKKSILLTSSKYSRTVNTPTVIDLSIVNLKLNPNQFTSPNLITGVLIEGVFTSVFTNRPSPFKRRNTINTQSQPTKMAIFSDGDLIKNMVRGVGENVETLPLGYDRYTKQTFGNKELILNTIHYLCDMGTLLETRTKDHKLRLLDKAKVAEQRLKWQLINVFLPIILVILSSFIYRHFRKKRFA